MAAQIKMFGVRVSKTKSLHYYGGAKCTVRELKKAGGFVASGGWGEWDHWGPTRRTARAAWRAARREDSPRVIPTNNKKHKRLMNRPS